MKINVESFLCDCRISAQ